MAPQAQPPLAPKVQVQTQPEVQVQTQPEVQVPGKTLRQAKVITVSDGVFHGVREDLSGVALTEFLKANEYDVVANVVVADGIESVSQALSEACQNFCGLVVTTGGTGFGPRDLTPEATTSVLERFAPGIAEAGRNVNPKFGALSRGVAGTLGQALVVNTPGSPKGCVEVLTGVLGFCNHALDLISGTVTLH